MHKPRSPSRKKHPIKEFQFPGVSHRASHTSSPLSLTAKIDLDSSLKPHKGHLTVKLSSENSTPTAPKPQPRPESLLSSKLRDIQAELDHVASEYQHAIEENEILRQQTLIYTSLRTTGSASTVFPLSGTKDEEDGKQSIADEVEDLTELLSNTHMTMALLLNERDDLREQIKTMKTEVNKMKFQSQVGGRSRDRQVEELSAQLTRENEELKAAQKEKKRIESRIQDSSRKTHELEAENRALRDKISILSRRSTDEFGTSAEIYKKVMVVRGLISQSEEKNRKNEGKSEGKAKKKR